MFGIVAQTFALLLFPIITVTVLLLYPSEVDPIFRLLSFLIYCTGIIITQIFLPVLTAEDSFAYLDNTNQFSFIELTTKIFTTFDPMSISLVSARFVFPAMLKPYLGDVMIIAPGFIALINSLIWIIAVFAWVELVSASKLIESTRRKFTLNTLFVMMLVTPSSFYWSAVLNKDVITTSMTIFASVALIKRRYGMAILWIVLATLLRSYAIAMVVAFYLAINGSNKTRLTALAGAFFVVWAYARGSFIPLVNTFVTTIYFFLSPNPSNLDNWLPYLNTGTWRLSPVILTIEGIFLGSMLAFGILISVLKERVRNVIATLFVSILICSAALTLVGYHLFLGMGESYSFFSFGDNFVRKKFSAWPLLMTWTVIILGEIYFSYKEQKKNNLKNELKKENILGGIVGLAKTSLVQKIGILRHK